MRYVQRVKSTLKQGVDVQLSPKTVLVGPNGAGKTSIVQSIELATCGWAGDMEGRSRVKLQGALARLFPSEQPMVCEVWLDDGTHFDWRMERSDDGGVKRPVHNPPLRVEWPIQDLMTVLGGEDAAVKAWLEEQVIGGLKPSDVLNALDKAVRPSVERLMTETGQTDFLALAQAAKKKAKAQRSAATRSESTVEKMTVGVPAPLLDSERQELEAELLRLRSVQGVPESEHVALKARIDGLVARIEQLDKQLEATPRPDMEAVAKVLTVENMTHLVHFHVNKFGTRECFVCGNQQPGIESRQKAIAKAAQAIAPSVEALATRRQLESERASAFTEAQTLVAQYKTESVKPDTSARQNELVSQLAADTTARKTWTNAEAARLEIEEMRDDANKLTKAIENLSRLGKELLDRKKAAFEAQVTSYLPEGDELGVDLDTARVGLRRGDELHSALSGSEWSRVLLALGSAETVNGVPRILVPEDRSWDKQMLEKVMTALKNSPSQVIIMSTTAPDPVEGWTMVDLR